MVVWSPHTQSCAIVNHTVIAVTSFNGFIGNSKDRESHMLITNFQLYLGYGNSHWNNVIDYNWGNALFVSSADHAKLI